MIKDVVNNSPFMQVLGGGGYTPHVNMSNSSSGMVRYNGNNQNFEVYDGSIWLTLTSQVASVGLSSEAVSLLEWAREQRQRELDRQALVDSNPQIKEAYLSLLDHEEKFEILLALVKKY